MVHPSFRGTKVILMVQRRLLIGLVRMRIVRAMGLYPAKGGEHDSLFLENVSKTEGTGGNVDRLCFPTRIFKHEYRTQARIAE